MTPKSNFNGRKIDIYKFDYCRIGYASKNFHTIGRITDKYELIFVKRGSIICTVNGIVERLSENTCIFIPPFKYITLVSDKSDVEVLSVAFFGKCRGEGYVFVDFSDKNLFRERVLFDILESLSENENTSSESVRVITEAIINIMLEDGGSVCSKIISDSAWEFKNVYWYIEKRLLDKVTVEMIASDNDMEEYHLRNLIKKYTGGGVVECQNKIRIQKSMMIMSTGVSAVKTSKMVGFCNQSYFADIFKRETGKSIGEFKAKIKSGDV